MKFLLFACGLLMGCMTQKSYAQTGEQQLDRYRATLRTIRTVSYQVQRIDTFTATTVWNHVGHGLLQRDAGSNLLQARFLVSQPEAASTFFHDGQVGYLVDEKARTYKSYPAPYAPFVLGSPSGQMVVQELLAIDSTYQKVTATSGTSGLVLTLHYPDKTKVDEVNRATYLTLDPTTGLPREVKTVVWRGGNKWTTIKRLSQVRVNQADDATKLLRPSFLETYVRQEPAPAPNTPSRIGQAAPLFDLLSLTQKSVKLQAYRGQVVLLDFWTTWCSPCIASMPKLQHLQQQYKQQRLVVLGVLLDHSGSATKPLGILQRQQATYINLLGTKAVQTAYQVHSYPQYVLIDRRGRIAFEGSGYSEELEAAVKAAVAAKAP